MIKKEVMIKPTDIAGIIKNYNVTRICDNLYKYSYDKKRDKFTKFRVNTEFDLDNLDNKLVYIDEEVKINPYILIRFYTSSAFSDIYIYFKDVGGIDEYIDDNPQLFNHLQVIKLVHSLSIK